MLPHPDPPPLDELEHREKRHDDLQPAGPFSEQCVKGHPILLGREHREERVHLLLNRELLPRDLQRRFTSPPEDLCERREEILQGDPFHQHVARGIEGVRRTDKHLALDLFQHPQRLRGFAKLNIPQHLGLQTIPEVRWALAVLQGLLGGRGMRNEGPHLEIGEHGELDEDFGRFLQVKRGAGTSNVLLGDRAERQGLEIHLPAVGEADQEIEGTGEAIRLNVVRHDSSSGRCVGSGVRQLVRRLPHVLYHPAIRRAAPGSCRRPAGRTRWDVPDSPIRYNPNPVPVESPYNHRTAGNIMRPTTPV